MGSGSQSWFSDTALGVLEMFFSCSLALLGRFAAGDFGPGLPEGASFPFAGAAFLLRMSPCDCTFTMCAFGGLTPLRGLQDDVIFTAFRGLTDDISWLGHSSATPGLMQSDALVLVSLLSL